MLYPARWKRITVDKSKVLKNWLFHFFGPPGIYILLGEKFWVKPGFPFFFYNSHCIHTPIICLWFLMQLLLLKRHAAISHPLNIRELWDFLWMILWIFLILSFFCLSLIYFEFLSSFSHSTLFIVCCKNLFYSILKKKKKKKKKIL